MEKKKFDKKSIMNIVFVGFAVACVLSIIMIILVYSRYTFHSDCAGFLFQAKEQVKQHKWFPDRFHYTTAIFGFSTSTFMIPFVNIINNDFLLHEIGSIIAVIVLVSLIWILFKNKKKIAALTTILLCMPLSYEYEDMLFFQSAYICTLILIVLNLIMILKLWNALEKKRSYKDVIISIILYLIVLLFANYAGVANYMYIEAPAILSLLCCIYIRNDMRLNEWKKENTIVNIIGLTVIGCILSFIIYNMICKAINFNVFQTEGGIISPNNLHETVWRVLPGILRNFGIDGTSSLFSVSAIKSCLAMLYFFIQLIIAPYLLLRKIDDFDIKDRFIILFCVITSFANLFLIIFGGMTESRYYMPGMLTGIITTAYFIEYVSEKYKNKIWLWGYAIILVFALCVHGGYYKYAMNSYGKDFSINNIINPTIDDGLVNILKDKGIEYGYATFWLAYNNMIISNSEITIAAYDRGNPMVPYYFDGNDRNNYNYYACSEDLYNPELHPGKCFVLVAEGEQIPDIYYELASDSFTYTGAKNYMVLIFEKNINYYEELKNL